VQPLVHQQDAENYYNQGCVGDEDCFMGDFAKTGQSIQNSKDEEKFRG